jgi:hypothetical protein
MIGDPGDCSYGMMGALALVAFESRVGIGAAVEGEHLRAGWELWSEDVIERPGRATVALEATDPVFGPEFHALLDAVGEVSLGWVKIGESMVAFGVVLIDHVLALAGFEAKDGGVPDLGAASEELLAAFNPVVNDADVVEAVIEKAVDVVGDEEVEIEKHALAFKASQVIAEERELEPGGGLESVGKFEGGQRKGLDAIVESSAVVGEAEEAKRSSEVASHTVEEAVDIVRTVTGAPLEGEDVDGIAGRLGHEWRRAQEGVVSGS